MTETDPERMGREIPEPVIDMDGRRLVSYVSVSRSRRFVQPRHIGWWWRLGRGPMEV